MAARHGQQPPRSLRYVQVVLCPCSNWENVPSMVGEGGQGDQSQDAVTAPVHDHSLHWELWMTQCPLSLGATEWLVPLQPV